MVGTTFDDAATLHCYAKDEPTLSELNECCSHECTEEHTCCYHNVHTVEVGN